MRNSGQREVQEYSQEAFELTFAALHGKWRKGIFAHRYRRCEYDRGFQEGFEGNVAVEYTT